MAAISEEFDILTGSRSPNEKLRSGRMNEAFAALQEKVNEARDQGVVIAAAGETPVFPETGPARTIPWSIDVEHLRCTVAGKRRSARIGYRFLESG